MRAAVVAMTLAVAALGWVFAVRRMDGMDMGTMTELGSFASFAPIWTAMMAAMMLPGMAPALVRRRRPSEALSFVAGHLALWSLVGIPVFLLYRPHGTTAAAALIVVAALYELTPLARLGRRHGVSAAPMLVPLALGPMSVTWMVVATALVLVEQLAPVRIPGVAQLTLGEEQTR